MGPGLCPGAGDEGDAESPSWGLGQSPNITEGVPGGGEVEAGFQAWGDENLMIGVHEDSLCTVVLQKGEAVLQSEDEAGSGEGVAHCAAFLVHNRYRDQAAVRGVPVLGLRR